MLPPRNDHSVQAFSTIYFASHNHHSDTAFGFSHGVRRPQPRYRTADIPLTIQRLSQVKQNLPAINSSSQAVTSLMLPVFYSRTWVGNTNVQLRFPACNNPAGPLGGSSAPLPFLVATSSVLGARLVCVDRQGD